jgi:8-oxo-dGTP diphosphatase
MRMLKLPADRPAFLVHASVAVVQGSQVLMVQEAKPSARGKWNLPGGHVEHHESILAAAARELYEEVGLRLSLEGLVGVYQGPASIRFVFQAQASNENVIPGRDILTARWTPIAQTLAQPDDELVSPGRLRAILRDLADGRMHPIGTICAEVL